MPADSGTSTDWLAEVSNRIVNVQCRCALEIAVERFCRRDRHPGHLDSEKSSVESLQSFHTLSRLAPLDIGHGIEVETSGTPEIDAIIREIQKAFLLHHQ